MRQDSLAARGLTAGPDSAHFALAPTLLVLTRELGKDTQTEDCTVVGIGDMARDVFGNGMLLSEHIGVVAAFNHLQAVFDPNPDEAGNSHWGQPAPTTRSTSPRSRPRGDSCRSQVTVTDFPRCS